MFRECRVSGDDTQRKPSSAWGANHTGDAHGRPLSSAVASVMYMFASTRRRAIAAKSFALLVIRRCEFGLGLDRRLPAEDPVEDRPDDGQDDHDQQPGPELPARERGATPNHVDDRDDPGDRRGGPEEPEPVHRSTL